MSDTLPLFDGLPPPGFVVLQGNRLEDLRDVLVAQIQRQPLPPLAAEVVLVQSNGMKHWLELALAHDDALGICAATRLELPSAFLWQAYRTVLGPQAVPQQLPLDKQALVWRLVRSLPQWVNQQPVYQALAHYLADDADGRKRLQLAQQVADVLDGYQSYRADWLSDWAQGQDSVRNAHGSAQALSADQAWQAQLWRDVLADLAEHSPASSAATPIRSRAEVHASFMQAMQAMRQAPAGLPPRITVFGMSSLPMQQVEALAALGQVCQVLMLVQNPCQYHWGDIVEGRELLQRLQRQRQAHKPGVPVTHVPLEQLHTQSHPLLAAWGKQGRDYLHLLTAYDAPEHYRRRFDTIDLFADPLPHGGLAPATRLQRLQSDILHLNPPPAQPEPLPTDDSVQLAMAYSAQREVEVLHDQLLQWLDADPTLQPSDVMVMVPDMAQFAPHVQAVFGRFAPGQARHIPYSVADVSSRQLPLARALEALLHLPQSRLTLADWLDAFEAPAVRQRFGLSSDDVSTLHTWLHEAGVRWGLDATHRQRWGLPAGLDGIDQNTWSFGIRRMLLGYAVGHGSAWQGVAPMGAVSGLSARLVGALVQWLDAMDDSLRQLQNPHTPAEWVQLLHGLAQRFFDPSDDAEERQLQSLLHPLNAWLDQCHTAALDEPLPLVLVREHWLSQWDSTGLSQRFFGGGVQFATLMPMRSIPFKVVCLLGMNDGAYPRRSAARDFDLMARYPRPGDRSRREDDRYLFLEALLSARSRLYISWQGRRASDDSEQPPSVLVAQLQDTLARYWQQPPQPVLYPLQPFSTRYFQAPPGQAPAFVTYDADWQTLLASGSATAAPATDAAQPPPMPSVWDLRSVVDFLREPVKWTLQKRMGLHLRLLEAEDDNAEPFLIDKLNQYLLAQTVLQAEDTEQALDTLRLCGALPLAAWGQRQANQLRKLAHTVHERQTPWLQTFPHTCPPISLNWPVGDGCFSGAVHGLRQRSTAVPDPQAPSQASHYLQLHMRPGAVAHKLDGRLHPRLHLLLPLWVEHVALCAQGHATGSTLLGLDAVVWLPPMAPTQAQAIGQTWWQAMQAAWQTPLPVACEAAVAYVQAATVAAAAQTQGRAPKQNPLEAARKTFDGGYAGASLLDKSPYLARCFSGFDDLAHGLPEWAQTLYGPLAQHAHINPSEAQA